MGNFKKMIVCFKKAFKMEEMDGAYHLGYHYNYCNKFVKAEKYLLKAIEKNHVKSMHLLGLLYYKKLNEIIHKRDMGIKSNKNVNILTGNIEQIEDKKQFAKKKEHYKTNCIKYLSLAIENDSIESYELLGDLFITQLVREK
jgi:TPR repeat protein